MKKIHVLILAVIAVALVIFLVLTSNSNPLGTNSGDGEVITVEADPVDAVMDFYSPWLSASKDENSNPYSAGHASKEVLTAEMSQRILDAQIAYEAGESDPVLCTTELPSRLRTKMISRQPDRAQILVLDGGNTPRPLAIVRLQGVGGEWKIAEIDCNAGEVPPEQGEFSFDNEGQLLKDSVPPPLNPEYWYLVYEQSGTFGYTAPLLLSEESLCVFTDGTESICTIDTFGETQKVRVQGQMTEGGVDVQRVQILEQ